MANQRIRAKNTISFVERVRIRYFEWLCEMVGNAEEIGGEIKPFLFFLHTMDFHWIIDTDENRAMDGKKLRERYQDENLSENCECLNGPCTVLEMLVALAFRADYALSGSQEHPSVSKLFWEMLDNLGLELFGNCEDDEAEQVKKYHDETKVRRFLERDYSPSGRGSIFPLKRPQQDQRQVELWYQMMSYLDENYHPV